MKVVPTDPLDNGSYAEPNSWLEAFHDRIEPRMLWWRLCDPRFCDALLGAGLGDGRTIRLAIEDRLRAEKTPYCSSILEAKTVEGVRLHELIKEVSNIAAQLSGMTADPEDRKLRAKVRHWQKEMRLFAAILKSGFSEPNARSIKLSSAKIEKLLKLDDPMNVAQFHGENAVAVELRLIQEGLAEWQQPKGRRSTAKHPLHFSESAGQKLLDLQNRVEHAIQLKKNELEGYRGGGGRQGRRNSVIIAGVGRLLLLLDFKPATPAYVGRGRKREDKTTYNRALVAVVEQVLDRSGIKFAPKAISNLVDQNPRLAHPPLTKYRPLGDAQGSQGILSFTETPRRPKRNPD